MVKVHRRASSQELPLVVRGRIRAARLRFPRRSRKDGLRRRARVRRRLSLLDTRRVVVTPDDARGVSAPAKRRAARGGGASRERIRDSRFPER